MIHTADCLHRHMGLYCIEPLYLRTALAHIRAGRVPPLQTAVNDQARPTDMIAVISINGPMFKGRSKFSEANTAALKQAVRDAAQSPDVSAILLSIDSPGGSVAGTADLADEVQAAAARKPVHAFIEDLGASAAYWVASQASRITATRTTEIGSIGVVSIIEDTSGKAALDGVVVHVISTGPHKGAFADGAPVLPEHLADLQQRVDDLNAHFLDAVARGRQMKRSDVEALADGRIHIASRAQQLGLIDQIGSFEDAVAGLRDEVSVRAPKVSRRRQAAAAIRMRELEGQP